MPKAPKPPRAKKPKAPCKYGPRDASGHCPKKPKAPKKARERKVRDYESVSAAGRQAGQVLRSREATTSQKKEAVKVLGTAVAGEVAKKVGEHAVRETRKAIAQPAVKAALKKAAPAVVAAGVAATLGAAVIAAAAVGIERNHAKQAAAWANRTLEDAAKKLPSLTPDQAATLWHQYYDYALKQPAATNTFLGK